MSGKVLLSDELPAEITDAYLLGQLTDQLLASTEQLEQALAMVLHQGETIAAAREFCLLVASVSAKTGQGVFRVNSESEDDPLVATLNHRFVDLAALLNRTGRPVPGKLAQGTIH